LKYFFDHFVFVAQVMFATHHPATLGAALQHAPFGIVAPWSPDACVRDIVAVVQAISVGARISILVFP
jgi:hypothetical protein